MRCSRRAGFTLLELLVVVSLLGLLVGILLPAISAARESSRKAQCTNRLRQLGMAVTQFHSAWDVFPPARLQARPDDHRQCGGREATWLVRVLPYLEEQALFDTWDLYRPWHQHGESSRLPAVHAYLCPSRRGLDEARVAREVPTKRMETKRAACGCSYTVAVDGAMEVEGIATDYAANHGDLSPGAMGATTDFYFGGNGTGILITSRPKCRNDAPIGWVDRIAARHVKDGLSQTMLLGEKHIAASELGEFPADSPGFDGDFLPASARLAGPGVPLARGPSDTGTVGVSFGSWHPGVCHFVFADGSVHALDVDTSTRVLAKLSHRSNGSAASVSSGP